MKKRVTLVIILRYTNHWVSKLPEFHQVPWWNKWSKNELLVTINIGIWTICTLWWFFLLIWRIWIFNNIKVSATSVNLAWYSVQFSRSVVSDSLRPYESQHTRPPCPSPTPRVYSNSCPSSRWCHPAISSSVVPFSSCPQSLTASGSFPVSQLFAWGGQSIGVSASVSVLH